MIPVEPWVAVAAILILQPLIAVVWVYVVYRAIVSFTTRKVSETIDGRVENAVEQIKGRE